MTTKDNMFNKTRIFLSVDVLGNNPHSMNWDFELSKLGACLYKDIPHAPVGNPPPMTVGQTISFEGFHTEIESIHWSVEHGAMFVYTKDIDLCKDVISNRIAYLLNLGFQKIGN